MESNTKILLTSIIVILAIWIVWPYIKSSLHSTSSESFNVVASSNVDERYERADKDPVINPMLYEPNLSIATSASEFVGMPSTILPAWNEEDVNINVGGYGDNDKLDDGANGNDGLLTNLCSPSCCAPQYPTPFALPVDPLTCKSKEKYVGSSYMCNNSWQNSGCLCMTQKQSDFLASRGGNGFNNSDIRDLN